MALAYKQLTKQIFQNRIFVSLLLLLIILTSLSFYFVMFSIDGNKAMLNTLTDLTENHQLYKKAIDANTSLAYTFLISTAGLTSFVFVMFFYRFYRANKRQIGCMKSLGFKDRSLCAYFVMFTGTLSVIGALLGLIGGYFMSDVLIQANATTYSVTGLVKDVSPSSLLVGFGGLTAIFCLTSFFCYQFVRGKEPGLFIAGNRSQAGLSLSLRAANCISGLIPTKNKFPLRLALRKPLSVFLIVVAVMSYSVCMILGQSLNISSQKVLESQTIGYHYEFDTKYSEFQTEPTPEGAVPYLDRTGRFMIGRHEIEQTVIGLHTFNGVYELQNAKGNMLAVLKAGEAYINSGLHEMYGLHPGNTFVADIAGVSLELTVADIAVNAKAASIYVNADQLSERIRIPIGAYNGVLSMEKMKGGIATTKEQRIENLNREAVSSNSSAVINQAIGGLIGAILIFIALYVNLQDNTRDILILHMMGYRTKQIRKTMIDVYMPIVWMVFALTLAPSIFMARSIQKSLSISTNDYMPFGTSIVVILFVFAVLNLIYWFVQALFGLGMKRIIAKEEITEIIYAE